jgi:lysozyme
MDLESQIKRDEGLRLQPYKDSLGKLTIGYGRCLETRGISKDEAEYLLANDLSAVKLEVGKRFQWSSQLSAPRLAVLHNMAFNMGTEGLGRFVKFLAHAKDGEFDAAAIEMLDSAWAKQVGDRATKLAHQFASGEWVG